MKINKEILVNYWRLIEFRTGIFPTLTINITMIFIVHRIEWVFEKA